MGTPQMTSAQLKTAIRNGQFTDAKIKEIIDAGRVTKDELLSEGIITESKLRQLYYVSPEQHKRNLFEGKYSLKEARELAIKGEIEQRDITDFHKQNIRMNRYSDEEIKQAIIAKELDSFNLINEGIITQDHLDDIFDRDLPLLNVGFDSWESMPALIPNRVDIFVLGIAGSGKSAFMAGLLYYAKRIGKLGQEIDNLGGYTYTNAITDAVHKGILPPRTPEEYIQYMACTFTSQEGNKVPMTFVEMSGEVFQKCYGKRNEDMPANFVQYMLHENSKVLMLAVDYKLHATNSPSHAYTSYGDTSQESQFDYIIRFMDKEGTLNYTKAICILITKWDMSPDQSEEAAIRFLESEYLGLFNLCQEMQAKYNLRFEIYRYSLGKFGRRNSYVYVPRDSETIYNWLCSFMPVQKERTSKNSWLGKMFKK